MRSSAPVIGFSVNMTPAAVGLRSLWTTTPTLGRVNRPTRWRYVIAESEFADHQTSRTAPGTSAGEWMLSRVRCWPAKLAAALSSSTADDRTANGGGKAAMLFASFSMALSVAAGCKDLAGRRVLSERPLQALHLAGATCGHDCRTAHQAQQLG